MSHVQPSVLVLIAVYGAQRFWGAANAQPIKINQEDPMDIQKATHYLVDTIEEFFGEILPLTVLWLLFFLFALFLAYIIPALVAVVLRRCIAQSNYIVVTVRILRSAIIFGGFLLAFGLIGIDIVGLFVGFGFFGLALSVGLGDAIGNWAAGILLQTDDSVQPGHRLVIPSYGIDGVIVQMDFKQIAVEPIDGKAEDGIRQRIYIPNKILTSAPHRVIRDISFPHRVSRVSQATIKTRATLHPLEHSEFDFSDFQ